MNHPCTLFISDLHLSPQEPQLSVLFQIFMQQIAIKADALYVLGDLFAEWIGDDNECELHQQFAKAFRELKQQGVPCYFLRGNRDFLLGEKYAQQAEFAVLPDYYYFFLYDQAVLLMHGDLLCTSDLGYQRFRKWMQKPWVQRVYLGLPLFMRRKLAQHAREKSQKHQQYFLQQNQAILDVNPDTVEQTIAQCPITTLIHGHTHTSVCQSYPQLNCQRRVLAAWGAQGHYLACDSHGQWMEQYFSENTSIPI